MESAFLFPATQFKTASCSMGLLFWETLRFPGAHVSWVHDFGDHFVHLSVPRQSLTNITGSQLDLLGLVNRKVLSVQLFATPWTVAQQAPMSMEFSRQEYWSRFLFPIPRDLPDPGTKPASPALQANSLLLSHWGSPGPSSLSKIMYQKNKKG